MALEDVSRRVLHVANGTQKEFPFAFTIFEKDQLAVYRTNEEGDEETVSPSEFTVTISTTGGTITFKKAPVESTLVAIVSAIPYTQPMALTNYGGFNPETLNHNADLQAAQIQQLKEELDRCLKLRPTDTTTARELNEKLEALTKLIEATRSQIVSQDRVWTITEAVEAGTTINLPTGFKYTVGMQHLHVYWNSLACAKGRDFMEVGSYGQSSSAITILFPLTAGDELIVRTVPASASV